MCFGIPEVDQGQLYGRFPSLIATEELWAFWDKNRTALHGFLFDLPAGRTTLKRMRSRLGFHFHRDQWDFWRDRAEELKSLSAREFAAKYEVDLNLVMEWRLRVVGKTARKPGWWRAPRVMKTLLSDSTLSEAGKKLRISISQTKRLRDRAKAESTARP